jgi:hypothetical protein
MTDPHISASGTSPQSGGPPAMPAPPPGPGVLQIEFAPTLADAAAFFRYDLKLSPRARRRAGVPPWVWLILLGIALTVVVLTRLMVPYLHSFDLFDGVFLVCMGVLLFWFLFSYLFGHRLTVRRSLKAAREKPRFFEKKTMTISPEGLGLNSPSGASITRWHAVVWVIEYGEHAFIYLTEREALVVPKRAFADARQFDEFVDTARRYHAEARRFVRTEGHA